MAAGTRSNYRDYDDSVLNEYWNDPPAPHNIPGSGSPYPSSPRESLVTDPFRTSVPSPQPDSIQLNEMRSYADRDREREDYAMMPGDTANSSGWFEKQPTAKSKSKVFLWTTITVGVLLIAGGITAGVIISHNNSAKSLSTSPTSTKSGSGSGSGLNGNSSDPSNFPKNDALKNSFYGFAYTPSGAILPECGATQDAVIEDIQLLSQLTTRIRTYGSDCNVSSFVLGAIQQTKVNMTVYLGIYIDTDDTVYQRQRDLTKTAIEEFGEDAVAGITVGNEFILDNMTAASQTDPSGPVGVAAAEFLKVKIADVRSMLSSMSLSKNIPVGTADAGGSFNTDILEAVDYAMANVHPWFADVTIAQAADWTPEYFQETDVALAKNTTKDPSFTIAETGWPTNSSTATAMQNQAGAEASVANLQTFIDGFVCQANQNQTGYFFFEFMDEPWKTVQYGGVEGYWGVFDSNKNLKNITIPDCSHV